MEIKTFNIRVYGIALRSNKVLVTDEYRFGRVITKFPGGGLEHGEGTIDCLKREIKEELAMEADVTEHFYTTDFYQPSAFDPNDQVISIYYKMNLQGNLDEHPAFIKQKLEKKEGAQVFRWVSFSELKEQAMTFPIDQLVVKMLLEEW